MNLTSNNFNWLPFELLQILRTTDDWACSTYHPNPFAIPLRATCPSEDVFASNRNSIHKNRRSEPFEVIRTRIAYLSISGLSIPGWTPAPSQHVMKETSSIHSASSQVPTALQKLYTPSLFEVALRACYRSANLAQLPFLLPDASPPSIPRALKMTWRLKAAGGQECSVCGRFYIVPRTEWLEWHWVQGRIPFIRRGCSWACAPDADRIGGKADEGDGVQVEIATGWKLP